MSAPRPHVDLRPLFTLAEQIDARGETLRVRARLVGHAPHAAGWYSLGARAFARSADEASAALFVVAMHLQRAAAQLREQAVVIATQPAGR